MFAIEATNEKGWRWISAICSDRGVAEDFLASVPEKVRPFQRLVELPIPKYPIFVLEDRSFEYGDAAFVRQRLAKLIPTGGEDDILLNVYIVEEDFIPEQAGEDSMGSLYHWHITDDSLKPPRSDVIESELREAERNAV